MTTISETTAKKPERGPDAADVLRTHFTTLSFLGGTVGAMGTEAVLVRAFPDLAPYRFQIWFQILYMTVVFPALPALEWNRRPDLGFVVEHRSALSVGRWLLLAVFLSVAAIPAASDVKDFVAVMVCFFAGFCAALADLAATEASLRALVSRRGPPATTLPRDRAGKHAATTVSEPTPSKIQVPINKGPGAQESGGEIERRSLVESVAPRSTDVEKQHYQDRGDKNVGGPCEHIADHGPGERVVSKDRLGIADVLRTHFTTLSFLGGTVGATGTGAVLVWTLPYSVGDPFALALYSVGYYFPFALALYYAMFVLAGLPALARDRSGPGFVFDNRSALSVGRWLLLAVFPSVAAIPATPETLYFLTMVLGGCTGLCAALADFGATKASLDARESRR